MTSFTSSLLLTWPGVWRRVVASLEEHHHPSFQPRIGYIGAKGQKKGNEKHEHNQYIKNASSLISKRGGQKLKSLFEKKSTENGTVRQKYKVLPQPFNGGTSVIFICIFD